MTTFMQGLPHLHPNRADRLVFSKKATPFDTFQYVLCVSRQVKPVRVLSTINLNQLERDVGTTVVSVQRLDLLVNLVVGQVSPVERCEV